MSPEIFRRAGTRTWHGRPKYGLSGADFSKMKVENIPWGIQDRDKIKIP